MLDRPEDSAAIEALRQQLMAFADASASEVQACLRTLSPDAILDVKRVTQALGANPRTGALRITGANRFIWIAGASASGTQNSKRDLIRYFDSVGRWMAGRFCAATLPRKQEEISSHVLLNAHFEDIRRVFPTTIQFRWVSKLILQGAADEIESDPIKYHELAWFTSAVVNDVFADLAARQQDFALPTQKLGSGADKFVRKVACAAGSLRNRSFVDLAVSTIPERFPYVQFDTGCRPLAFRESNCALEQSYFELVKRCVADSKTRGDLFERVASRCIQAVGPQDLVELKQPLRVPVPGSKNPREVDLAFSSQSDRLVLGECKAYYVATHSYSVVNAFEEDMKKAAEQLDTRVKAIDEGNALTSNGKPVGIYCRSNIIALGIPLHSYATAVWNADTLAAAEAVRPGLGIIPLHQLIIVVQSMRNIDELSRYIDQRYRLQASRVNVADECDMLIIHLNPQGAAVLSAAEEAGSKGSATLLPCHVSMHDALQRERPDDRGEWRRWLYKVAEVG
ncbi:hypothetical protein [Actinoplanes sp. NPDC051411]|uniref:hypothetical protein n=1 Tax=Actinoplanes sp. NPDC051411 TaxID=3155522 RepID=UPI00343C8576